jgi:hypothetical protein
MQSHPLGIELNLGRGQRPQLPQEPKTTCTGQSSGPGRDFQKFAPFHNLCFRSGLWNYFERPGNAMQGWWN